jgi:excisionase family DNA binding protein
MIALFQRETMSTTEPTKYLTVREAAIRLKVHPNTIKRMIHRKELAAIQVTARRDFRIPESEIERYERENSI